MVRTQGVPEVSNPAVEKAKKHFAGVVEEQLRRIEKMKEQDDWVDHSKLAPIQVGILGGDNRKR